MSQTTFGKTFLKELEAEVTATRKCLERIPEKLYDFKPHERSMPMGYLTLLVAEIPLWITLMIEDSEIDFATYKHLQLSTTDALVKHFDDNIAGAKKALSNVSDEALQDTFSLKNNGQVIYSASKLVNLEPTINHLVHHRGQLTVYMRMNEIPVPSIYGPSGDDRAGF